MFPVWALLPQTPEKLPMEERSWGGQQDAESETQTQREGTGRQEGQEGEGGKGPPEKGLGRMGVRVKVQEEEGRAAGWGESHTFWEVGLGGGGM